MGGYLQKRRKQLCVLLTLILLLPAVGLLSTRYVVAWLLQSTFSTPAEAPSWRRYLPKTASDIHEWNWVDTFKGDYSYCMKASMSEGEFQQFVKDRGLKLHSSAQKSDEADWQWTSQVEVKGGWWSPPNSFDNTYVATDTHMRTFAKYENGALYFTSYSL